MKGLDYAEKTYPFIDKDRECALGASYGGYAINWILGHTDRFKCLVSHDGMFNAESAWGTTEELWFNDWEFKGTPYDNRAMYEKLVAAPVREEFQDAHSRNSRPTRLPPRRERRLALSLLCKWKACRQRCLYFPDEGHWVLKPQNRSFGTRRSTTGWINGRKTKGRKTKGRKIKGRKIRGRRSERGLTAQLQRSSGGPASSESASAYRGAQRRWVDRL